jgi:hypothetical protein
MFAMEAETLGAMPDDGLDDASAVVEQCGEGAELGVGEAKEARANLG